MNAAKLVNIFEITKCFVQKMMFVHKFVNLLESLNKNICKNVL